MGLHGVHGQQQQGWLRQCISLRTVMYVSLIDLCLYYYFYYYHHYYYHYYYHYQGWGGAGGGMEQSMLC